MTKQEKGVSKWGKRKRFSLRCRQLLTLQVYSADGEKKIGCEQQSKDADKEITQNSEKNKLQRYLLHQKKSHMDWPWSIPVQKKIHRQCCMNSGTHCVGVGTSQQKAKHFKCGIEYRNLISRPDMGIGLRKMVSVYLLARVFFSHCFFTSQQTVTVELWASKCNNDTTATYLRFFALSSNLGQRSLM